MTQQGPRRVVLAPDKFKGSLTAAEVAAALAEGIARSAPRTQVVRLPVADGGDGTVDAFLAAGWDRISLEAPGPTGRATPTVYARRGDTAVIELAAVVGLSKLLGGQWDPLHASTYGLGVVIAHALDRGARDIVLGVGGSASTDGGAGMLQALGLRILDDAGVELPSGGRESEDRAGRREVAHRAGVSRGRARGVRGDASPRGGAALLYAAQVDRSGLHPALEHARITLASDVTNPLLGPNGAVAVYAPQKGASADDQVILEAALENWARLIAPEQADRPGAGAAGGTGFGAMAVLGATPRPGIEVVLELIDFPAHLAAADLVVTGEGSLDTQSLHGKAPMGVCAAARAAGIPVLAVAGRIQLSAAQVRAAGFAAAQALSDLEPNPERCIANAADLLRRVGERIGADGLRRP
ncbi:glycerate kinase [Nocardia sp. NPDC050406]|uniref:glycerate kinase n=1 Tax=Nocardia sp. NPDC050406 TaxID=3364318 RepID=UPI0037BAB9FA